MCKVCRLDTAQELQSPSAETKELLEMFASSRQVRDRAGVRAGPSQGGRVLRQLSELAGPSAYGAVVLGCFVFKELSKNLSIWAPSARRGAKQMVCKQNQLRPRKGKETCPKRRAAS